MGAAAMDATVLILPLLVVLAVIVVGGRRRGAGWLVVLTRSVLACWLAAVLALVMYPFPLPPYEPSIQPPGWTILDWISPPFATIDAALQYGVTAQEALQLVGNVLLFVPLGFLAPALTPRFRTVARSASLGLLVSLAIELAQLATTLALHPFRSADLDDVMLNTIGTVIGFAAWRVASMLLVELRRREAPAV